VAVSEDVSFVELIRRVRARDEQAAAELVRRYEPAIRAAVHVRLRDPALRRMFDSMDVCQSVLANFFVRAALGQFDLERPEQLLKLLATMARNKLTNYALRQRAARRDHRRVEPGDAGARDELAAPGPGPSQVATHRELLEEVYRHLSDDERRIADRRVLGHSWAEIATEVGGSRDALRLRFSRALVRVAGDLGLEE
jgi:RNA polymerase sigma-70 factor (ECF subfamily)